MVGGGLYALRRSERPTRSTPICQESEEMTALERVIRLAREIEERTEDDPVALEPDIEFPTVLVELRTVTADVLAAWLSSYEADGLPGLPAAEIAEIREACRDAVRDAWARSAEEPGAGR